MDGATRRAIHAINRVRCLPLPVWLADRIIIAIYRLYIHAYLRPRFGWLRFKFDLVFPFRWRL